MPTTYDLIAFDGRHIVVTCHLRYILLLIKKHAEAEMVIITTDFEGDVPRTERIPVKYF